MFYDAIEPLKNKLLTLLIQFPPYLKIKEGLEALRQYDFFFDDTYRYAIEIRHPSWFSDLAYNFFKNNNICLVWNQLDIIQTPSVVTSDFVYIRLIGDRSQQPAGAFPGARRWPARGGRVVQVRRPVRPCQVGVDGKQPIVAAADET